MAKYSQETRNQKVEAFHSWLLQNPECTAAEAAEAGHDYVLRNVYRSRINYAKERLGLEGRKDFWMRSFSDEERETRRQDFLAWLKDNPDATSDEAIDGGHSYALWSTYSGRINDARIDAGVKTKPSHGVKKYSEEEIERLNEEFIVWLKDNPDGTTLQAIEEGHQYVLKRVYKSGIEVIKKSLGIQTRKDSLEASRLAAKKGVDSILLSNPGICRRDLDPGLDSDLRRVYGSLQNAKDQVLNPLLVFYSRKDGERLKWELEDFQGWLVEHPDAKITDIEGTRHYRVFNAFYNNKLNEAKREAGVEPTRTQKSKSIKRRRKHKPYSWGYRDIRLKAYIRKNPRCSQKDVEDLGFSSTLKRFYRNRINYAKSSIGIQGKKYSPKIDRKEKTRELLDWLRENPTATKTEAIEAGYQIVFRDVLKSGINRARELAGLPLGKEERENLVFQKGIEFMSPQRIEMKLLDYNDPEDLVIKNETKSNVRKVLNSMKEYDKEILVSRLMKKETLQAVGNRRSVTRENIRQLQKKAEKVFRHRFLSLYDFDL